MKIEKVEAITLLYEYPQGFQYAGGICTGRLTTLVRVFTDTGHVGIGSGYTHPGMMHLVVEHQLAPLLIGKDPREVEELWDYMYGVTRWYGRKGATMTAIGALDTAFWDLKAQAAGEPLWKTLGGTTDQCPAYASALLWKEIDELTQEAEELRNQGFCRMKARLARNEEYDIAAVRALRKTLGSDCDFMVDGSMRFDTKRAKQFAEVLKEENVFWFEEPFAPEDIDSFVELRPQIEVPLAAGENEFGFQGFRELIRAGAVDIAQPDVARCGGVSETVKICKLAKEHRLQAATHSWNDAVAIVANAHVISAMENGLTVEIDRTGNPFVDELLGTSFEVKEGRISLTDRPGLGIKLNEGVLNRYRLADPMNLPDGCYSDMFFGKS